MEDARPPRIPLTNSLQMSAQVSPGARIFSHEGPRDARDAHIPPCTARPRRAGSCGRAGADVADGAAGRNVEGRLEHGSNHRVAPAGRERRLDVLQDGSQRVYEEEPLRSAPVAGDEEARGRETSGSGGRRRRDPASPTPLGPRHRAPVDDRRDAADSVVEGPQPPLAPQWGVGRADFRRGGLSPSPFLWPGPKPVTLSGPRGARGEARR
jgi:hypothetical protein